MVPAPGQRLCNCMNGDQKRMIRADFGLSETVVDPFLFEEGLIERICSVTP